ncbi:MAG: GNAT family protein [Myxococcota bacterium]|nr:GNAT family protein [Myxococcota bacterium]
MSISPSSKILNRVQLQPEDAPTLFKLIEQNRAHLSPWLPWVDSTQAVGHSLAFIEASLNAATTGTALRFGILVNNELAGMIGLESLNAPPRTAQIGYWLAAQEQGQGIIRRILPEIIEHGFETLDLTRVEIRVCPNNQRSRAIPLALGFCLQQVLPAGETSGGVDYDQEQFILNKADWALKIREPTP